MPRITVKKNIRKDAWNWWHACNKTSYNISWKVRVSKKIQDKIVGKTQKQAFVFLIPYLQKIYLKKKIDKRLMEVKNIFKENQAEIFSRMEKVTNKKIYRPDFTCFLTTFPRAPYHYPHGYIWIPVVWSRQSHIQTFIHELLHFQTYAYFEKKCLKHLNKNEFENLKESLTVILNEEFIDLMIWPDKGYSMHQNLRKKLLKFWKKNKDFNKLIDYGIKIYPKDNKYASKKH